MRNARSWLGVWFIVSALTACSELPTRRVDRPSAQLGLVLHERQAQASSWDSLPGWGPAAVADVWPAFRDECRVLKKQAVWSTVCAVALETKPDNLQKFFEESFTPYRVVNPDTSDTGLITGYYEPLLYGSRTSTKEYRHPIYAVPSDLLPLSALPGEVGRGRRQGKSTVPYYTRAEINRGVQGLRGRELFWVRDPVELFFLQVQGSGRIELPDGYVGRVQYADNNGHPYTSIGKELVARGTLPATAASMRSIRDWAAKNPKQVADLLETNARYVFFKEVPNSTLGPPGALGVPLTPGCSLAVDPRYIPLGAPIFLSTTEPGSTVPLERLMLAQDTGSAVKGAVRADFFWGFGQEAGKTAGRMHQSGRMWVLLPKKQSALPEEVGVVAGVSQSGL